MARVRLLLLVLVALGLRLHDLARVPMRWDEGWSVALARLPLAECLRLTALDVHPPLYYLSLVPWLALARSPESWLRLPSVLAGTLAVPLAVVAAAAWWRGAGDTGRRAGLLAGACTALAPVLVYYAGVTRMYAQTTPLLLLAALGLARLAEHGRARWALAAVAGASGALYTFYYTGFALAGLFAAALIAWPRAWRGTLAVAVATALAYVPWLAYAAPRMLARTTERTGPAGFQVAAVPGMLDDGLHATVFGHDAGWLALTVVLVVLAAGCVLARPTMPAHLAVVVLPAVATLAGAALGAQAHMFAARYTIGATPFLALGAGWALAGLWSRARWLALVGAGALAMSVAPTFTGTVYQRAGEVSGAYDPAADWQELHARAGPDDLVAFNILSLAGAYERYRTPADPTWTYAQVWDPVREPEDLAVGRVADAAPGHPRLWLVLYRGTASPGSAALKSWADGTLFPSEGRWTEDRLYQSYVTAQPDRTAAPHATFDGIVTLLAADYSRQTSPGGGVAVALEWRAPARPREDGRVFVHLYAPDGSLVAQHDAFPAADTRPPTTWQPGEIVADRHGLAVPPTARGALTIRVGLYDPTTGRRWTLADGSDGVTIGTVDVTDAGDVGR
jgi:mannosyltransferase